MKTLNICLILPLLLFLAGCGETKVKVSGKVTLEDGTPITVGQVLFNSSGYAVTGDIQPDGTYKLGEQKDGDGIRPGQYTVTVVKAVEPDPASPNPERPRLLRLTDPSFSQDVDVSKSMTLDLQVPPNRAVRRAAEGRQPAPPSPSSR